MSPVYEIREMSAADLAPIKAFTDQAIGDGYYSLNEIEDIFERSRLNGRTYSLVLVDGDGAIKGVRITYPPGRWEHGKGKGLSPAAWPYPLASTAYFQSLFLAPELQGQGYGGRLSLQALGRLKELGAKGVVCHSWKESPNNSSTRYLMKLGFKPVAEHLEYWKDVDYNCTRCGSPPCRCTAIEMYLDLKGEK